MKVVAVMMMVDSVDAAADGVVGDVPVAATYGDVGHDGSYNDDDNCSCDGDSGSSDDADGDDNDDDGVVDDADNDKLKIMLDMIVVVVMKNVVDIIVN